MQWLQYSERDKNEILKPWSTDHENKEVFEIGIKQDTKTKTVPNICIDELTAFEDKYL